ncbi:ribonuclease P/MRP protein subunit POP5-like [Manduca sexta]|uniref:ribonuclease P/MRP protein subunit POP5-like n=1 Tax=Manduca sexta TaxID=7130 RepID=UPI00188DD20C|nr:ribonuclease P/MRP protein subunit POP5-like [Manduca sexta]
MVRFKNRYVTVEISSPGVADDVPLKLKSKMFYETVLNKVQQLHGDYGVAAIRAGLLTRYCNEYTRIAILRVRHGPHMFVTSTLPFITKIGTLDVRLNTLHVSATLKHSFKFIQEHQRAYLVNKWSKLKSDVERKYMEQVVMDFTDVDVAINLEKFA